MNPDWDLHYNNVSFSGLNRFFFSDHVPPCLSTDSSQVKNKDFRYEICWRLRPDFRQKVNDNWSLPVRSRCNIDAWKEKQRD